ncbi:MAG: methionyl-tRNA formyltransferase [Thermomicrobiales bacterium]
MSKKLRVVFFGTPAYAVPALTALEADSRFSVELVVTQPDRPAGRGKALTPPAVKVEALRLALPLYQPSTLRDAMSRQPLVDADADLFVVAAFGLIFGEKTLAIPRIAPVNLHASLLPAYRGASPISAAIENGDPETGVSLMVMERGLDSGPVIATRSIPIGPNATTESLTAELARIGASLLIDEMGAFASGETIPTPQPEDGVTLVRPLTKSDGEIDWSQSAEQIERHIRAMWPWPRASASIDSTTVQIHSASIAGAIGLQPGRIAIDGETVIVGTGDGTLILDSVQFPGKGPIDGRTLANSRRLKNGDRFGLEISERSPMIKALDSGSSTTAG